MDKIIFYILILMLCSGCSISYNKYQECKVNGQIVDCDDLKDYKDFYNIK